MSRREQKERTRRLILDAARRQLEERGFPATTTRDIAAEAGVAVGTLFVHFPDKLSLAAAVLHQSIEETLTRARDTLPAGADLRAHMRHLVRCLLDNYARRPALARHLIMATPLVEGEWGARIRAQVEAFLAGIAALVEGERLAGRMRQDVDSTWVAVGIWSMYQTALVVAMGSDFADVDGAVAMFDRLVDQLFEGVY